VLLIAITLPGTDVHVICIARCWNEWLAVRSQRVWHSCITNLLRSFRTQAPAPK
jgi:hypothetical protein